MDFVMPQPGHGKPVSILNGQSDCAVSRWLLLLCNIMIYGISSASNAPMIPYILRTLRVLFIELVNITLYNHCCNHRTKETKHKQKRGLIFCSLPSHFMNSRQPIFTSEIIEI